MTGSPKTAFQLFRSVGFLESISDEDLTKVADLSSIEQRAAGDVLFQEGNTFDRFILLGSGIVALDMHVPRRGQMRILTVGPGEVLGWSSLLSDQRMTTMATVLEDATLVMMPAARLKELCDTDRDIGYALMQRMAIALSRRLLATRLQLLDVFSETQPF